MNTSSLRSSQSGNDASPPSGSYLPSKTNWSRLPLTTFTVRPSTYILKHHRVKKVQPLFAVYEPVAVDVVKSERRLGDVGSKVTFPWVAEEEVGGMEVRDRVCEERSDQLSGAISNAARRLVADLPHRELHA